ncbi:MAG: TRAP transporter large permease subunit, partial [Clostridia bacterium]|nr:TRAP transporter large permease subunit [Clostridia bacterium]
MREEILIAIVMLGISIIGSVITRNDKKWSVAFLLLAAVAGSLTAGMGVRFREIVEGPFGFLDSALCICAAAVFVGILNHAGAFDALLDAISRLRCKTAKALLVLLVIALPAMLTGLASVSVLTTGTLVGKRMKQQGVSNEKSVAIVVVGSFLGMILPPNCLPAMIAANGAGSVLPTPYVGFFVPLALMGIPSLILFACMNRNALALEPAEAKDKKTLLLVLLALV